MRMASVCWPLFSVLSRTLRIQSSLPSPPALHRVAMNVSQLLVRIDAHLRTLELPQILRLPIHRPDTLASMKRRVGGTALPQLAEQQVSVLGRDNVTIDVKPKLRRTRSSAASETCLGMGW
jgi:hypothetical protein